MEILELVPSNSRRNTSIPKIELLQSGDKADTCIHFCIHFPFFLLRSGDRADTSIHFKNPYPQLSSPHAGKIGCSY
jgi:hypothetical protein